MRLLFSILIIFFTYTFVFAEDKSNIPVVNYELVSNTTDFNHFLYLNPVSTYIDSEIVFFSAGVDYSYKSDGMFGFNISAHKSYYSFDLMSIGYEDPTYVSAEMVDSSLFNAEGSIVYYFFNENVKGDLPVTIGTLMTGVNTYTDYMMMIPAKQRARYGVRVGGSYSKFTKKTKYTNYNPLLSNLVEQFEQDPFDFFIGVEFSSAFHLAYNLLDKPLIKVFEKEHKTTTYSLLYADLKFNPESDAIAKYSGVRIGLQGGSDTGFGGKIEIGHSNQNGFYGIVAVGLGIFR